MGAGKLLGLRAVAVGKVGHGPPVGEGKALAPRHKRNNKAHTKPGWLTSEELDVVVRTCNEPHLCVWEN